MRRKKRILIAPLDWGLGHAARCIPIIREIIAQDHEPVIAADGRAYDLLKSEFPELKILRLKGYHPVYPKESNMVWTMLLQAPRFLYRIAWEYFALKPLIKKHSIDIVISDNRYGLWSSEIPSILITHQLFIKMPDAFKWMEPAVNKLNHFFIHRFHQCWVPDIAGDESLSGLLSHGKSELSNVRFIGMLSRMKWAGDNGSGARGQGQGAGSGRYSLLVLLSGPEPQRSILEKEIMPQIDRLGLQTLVVRGITEENERNFINDELEMVSHLTSEKLNEALLAAEVVVCRSGYSTLMDIAAIGKKAILIPTPGQTEQEYLAKRFDEKKLAIVQQQGNLNLKEALEKLEEMAFVPIKFSGEDYKKEIAELVG